MRRAVFSILVGNSSGVLSRVARMFSRRGYNIDSLTVGELSIPELSRMTIAVTGEDDVTWIPVRQVLQHRTRNPQTFCRKTGVC